ncbi:hypothetical protein PSNIH1_18915 (plasmid) [Pantoea sp. PSNIH1]|nr:hypothetical protein PSNIH1_18915 [Pantoea sp. PSNIH1]
MISFYLRFICLIFVGFMAYGHAAPWLISSKDTVLCIAGFIVLATMPIYAWLILKWLKHVMHVISNQLSKATKREN